MYFIFEIFIKVIEKAGWQVPMPLKLHEQDSSAAEAFIKKPPTRDRRKNWDGDCLRILQIQIEHHQQVDITDPVLQAAVKQKWIPAEFQRLLENGNVGCSLLMTANTSSLIVQMPNNDRDLLTLILTCVPTGRQNDKAQTESDWVCIILSHEVIDLELLLAKDPFPTDYSLLSPDFMILPVSLLKWQVERLVQELKTETDCIIEEEDKLISEFWPSSLNRPRRRIFEISRSHLKLRHKWLSNQEFAATLNQYFEIVERRYSMEDFTPKYSETLRQRVHMDDQLCKSLEYDIQVMPLKIEALRNMIDSRFHMMIAQSSAECAEESRRDSSSMKTMAAMTLLFLPATTISSIFSMDLFDWDAKTVSLIGAQYLWLYIAIALPLTVIVLLVWISWVKWMQSKDKARKLEREYEC